MQLLFRLPLLLLEMLLRRGAEAVLGVVGLVRDDAGDDVVSPVQEPPAPTPPPGAAVGSRGRRPPPPPPPPAAPTPPPAAPAYTAPPPPSAEEAMERRRSREREAAETGNGSVEPEAAARVRPVSDETPSHVDREAEVVESFGPAEDVVATLQVDAPWDDYDKLPAAEIVSRLRDADPATKGVVRMYEQQHKKRATVLRATG